MLLIIFIEDNDILLEHAVTSLTTEIWLILLSSIRAIYNGPKIVNICRVPKILSFKLHSWSRDITFYLSTLKRLESVLGYRSVIKMFLLGSTPPENAKFLQVLHLITNSGYPC